MKLKLLISALVMVSVLAVSACTSDEGPTDADLQNAQATASAAQAAAAAAEARAVAAEERADAAEKTAMEKEEMMMEMEKEGGMEMDEEAVMEMMMEMDAEEIVEMIGEERMMEIMEMMGDEMMEAMGDEMMGMMEMMDAMEDGAIIEMIMEDEEVMKMVMEMMDAMGDGMMTGMGDGMMMEAGARLAQVRERGKVICASRNDVPGYGALDSAGRNVGFDIDLCRAVAAAVLGDPESIEIQFITAAERGPTIQSGEVDLLVRTVTWTTSRDAQWGNFAQTMFYDGQGFMVPKELGVTSAYELGGAAVCVTSGTTTELNMADFFRQNNLEYNPQVFEDTDIVLDSYKSGACDVFTNDRSQLAALRTALPNPEDHIILPETISEEPLGPVVPHGDEQWFDIVKTVMSGLIYAEAYGINSDNAHQMADGDDVKVKRLLGTEGTIGQEALGLSDTFLQDVIYAVGNYGEIYDRNLGPDGIDLPREGGRNALWSDAPCSDCPKGGQIYAAPLR